MKKVVVGGLAIFGGACGLALLALLGAGYAEQQQAAQDYADQTSEKNSAS